MIHIHSIARWVTSWILFAAIATPAVAQSRFEVLDGALIDHKTGLIWQSLTETAGTPLPLSPQLGSSRVATLNEVFDLLPLTAGSTQTVSVNSDLYTALSFFTVTSPKNATLCNGFAPQGASCFGGWAAEANAPGTYDIGLFWVAASPGQSSEVSYFSTATMGNYSQSFCSFACNAGQFTVRTVPEPSQQAFLLTGLGLVLLLKRTSTYAKS